MSDSSGTQLIRAGKCIIFGAGDFFGLQTTPGPDDLLIAADGGLEKVIDLGLEPDLILGDFDSLKPDFDFGQIKKGTEFLRFPPEKDDTDMMLAVKEGLKRGFKTFVIYGGTGDRIDHLLANIQTLIYLSKSNASGWLYGSNYKITAVTDDKIALYARPGATVSVFSFGDKAEGVTLSGVKYPLADATLCCDFPLGVSNVAVDVNVVIEVKKGTLAIVLYE